MYVEMSKEEIKNVDNARKALNSQLQFTLTKADYYNFCIRLASNLIAEKKLKRDEVLSFLIKL